MRIRSARSSPAPRWPSLAVVVLALAAAPPAEGHGRPGGGYGGYRGVQGHRSIAHQRTFSYPRHFGRPRTFSHYRPLRHRVPAFHRFTPSRRVIYPYRPLHRVHTPVSYVYPASYGYRFGGIGAVDPGPA